MKWATQKRKIADLKEYELNPRKISPAMFERLKKSITELGYAELVTIDTDNVIVAGHQRIRAMIAMGKGNDEIEVRVPERKLTKKEFEQYLLISNKVTGEFDNELLAEFDEDILLDSGFESKEVDKILDTLEEDDFDGDKEAEKIINPTAKEGDVYKLGRHRLMCGNSADEKHVDILMGGGLADLVFTDPPYNVNYSGKGKSTSNTIKNDDMSEEEFRKMLNAWFANYKRVMKPEAPLYCCYANQTHREFEDALNQNGFEVRNQIIWVKKVASFGCGDYRWKHEPILYCHQKGASMPFYGDRKQYTEWTEEMSDEELLKHVKGIIEKDETGGSTVWRLHREMKYDHPTQKPIKLVSIAVRNSSKRGDVVLDLFGGSGSTLITCQELNRTAYTMELDPRYVDVIIKRWEKLTGEKVEKIK